MTDLLQKQVGRRVSYIPVRNGEPGVSGDVPEQNLAVRVPTRTDDLSQIDRIRREATEVFSDDLLSGIPFRRDTRSLWYLISLVELRAIGKLSERVGGCTVRFSDF